MRLGLRTGNFGINHRYVTGVEWLTDPMIATLAYLEWR